MDKWSDPVILAQMQALAKEMAAEAKPSAFDVAMAEAHKNGRSGNPAHYIPARLMAVMLPVFEGIDNAARTQDTELIVKMVNGLAMAIAMLQAATSSRLPDYILEILQELVDCNMRDIKAEVRKPKGNKP